MQYSDEFKDLVMEGYYCDLVGQTIRFSNYEHICNLLETGNGNEELGKLLEEGCKSNTYFSPEEILEHLNQLDLNVLREKAEMTIARKKHIYYGNKNIVFKCKHNNILICQL